MDVSEPESAPAWHTVHDIRGRQQGMCQGKCLQDMDNGIIDFRPVDSWFFPDLISQFSVQKLFKIGEELDELKVILGQLFD